MTLKRQPDPLDAPGFLATLSASQAGKTSGTAYKVPFDVEEFDRGGAYDNATNYRWTPMVGLHLWTFFVDTIADTAGQYRLATGALRKNGADWKYIQVLSNSVAFVDRLGVAGSIPIESTNGTDYYELWVYGYTGVGTWSIVGNGSGLVSYMGAVRIG